MVEARSERLRADGESTVGRVGGLPSVLVAGEDTGGRFAVVETLERKGSDHPYRVHTREDQAVYILEGLVRYCMDGEWLRCPEGTCLLLPRGREHTYAVESERARLLVILVPAGFEGHYREVDDRDGSSHTGAPDFERLVTVSARYGVEIVVPEAVTGIEREEPGMEQQG